MSCRRTLHIEAQVSRKQLSQVTFTWQWGKIKMPRDCNEIRAKFLLEYCLFTLLTNKSFLLYSHIIISDRLEHAHRLWRLTVTRRDGGVITGSPLGTSRPSDPNRFSRVLETPKTRLHIWSSCVRKTHWNQSLSHFWEKDVGLLRSYVWWGRLTLLPGPVDFSWRIVLSPPQRIQADGLALSLMFFMSNSVKGFQIDRWEAAWPCVIVNAVFRRSTPFLVQLLKSPSLKSTFHPSNATSNSTFKTAGTSRASSPDLRLKAKPVALPAWGVGSWPSIITFILAGDTLFNASSIFLSGGSIRVPFCFKIFASLREISIIAFFTSSSSKNVFQGVG